MDNQDNTKKTTMIAIDRIEGEWAIVDCDGFSFRLPVACLPAKIKEGLLLSLTVVIDFHATGDKQQEITELQQELLQRRSKPL